MKMVQVLCAFLALVGCVYGTINVQVIREEIVYLQSSNDFRTSSKTPKLVGFTALNKTYTLNLQQTSVFLKSFKVTSYIDDEFGSYTEKVVQVNMDELKDNFYWDLEMGSALYYKDNGESVEMEGFIEENIIILPMTVNQSSNQNNSNGHRVLELVRNGSFVDDYINLDFVVPDFVFNQTAQNASEVNIPALIEPEVLVVVDVAHYKALMAPSDDKVVRYVGIFWNAVNKLYAQVPEPHKVSLVLAGLIINKSPNAQPFMETNRVQNLVDGEAALGDLTKFALTWNYTEYDLAMVMTGEDLGINYGTEISPYLAGIAYVGGACVASPEGTYRVGISEDYPNKYSGVFTAAHEMGHLLGAVHDGDGPSYLGGPGAATCKVSDGYLMAPVAGGTNNDKFSSCSVQQFQFFFGHPNADCLREGVTGIRFPPLVELVNQTEICQELFPEYDSTAVDAVLDTEMCSRVICRVGRQLYKYSTTVLFDGVTCDLQKICKSGKCVGGDNN